MDHASFAGIVCIYIGSHTILGFVITPDSFRLTIFTCTMILVLDRVQECHLLWRVAFYEKTCFLAEFFFKKCRQLQGPPYTGVNDRNIVCTLMFVCNIMYIYIISVFNFVIKHALFRHDNQIHVCCLFNILQDVTRAITLLFFLFLFSKSNNPNKCFIKGTILVNL